MSGRLAAAVLSLVVGTASLALDVPAPDGWVTDLAGLLTPEQEQALETLMESYKAGSDNEIALLTVPDLGGRPLESYALEVARGWKIGERDRHNGALLLVAKSERQVRIEVGRGLEGTLTDSISGRIIRDVITPEFKQGRFYPGLRAGIEALHAAAGGDYGKIPKPARGRDRAPWVLPLIFFAVLVLARGFDRRGPRGGSRGGSTGGILPWLILGSLTSGRGGRSAGWSGGGGFGGFGGGGGFSGGGASGRW